MRQFPLLLLASLAGMSLVGCNTDQGPTRYRISGEVTFDGKPLPFGDILFTPDGSKQNSGPQGIAYIKDGKFDSAWPNGQGISGGATVIRVTGLGDADGKKLLCEHEFQIELPKEDSTLKVEVPANAALLRPASPEI